MKAFLQELNKRRVTRVPIAYLIIAWVVLQVADVVLPALALPDWTITLVLVLVVLVAGFPLAVVLSWLFDIGPGGIERTDAGQTEPPARPGPGRRACPLPCCRSPTSAPSRTRAISATG